MTNLKEIYHFIETASVEDCARIIEEIRCCHDNLVCWDEETRLLASIESIGINQESIQLNTKE